MAYARFVVTYFDVLGFKNRVDRADTPEAVERIAVDLRRLRTESQPHEIWDGLPADLQDEIHFVSFSDTVIRATALESGGNIQVPIGILWSELSTVARIQAESVVAGMVLRGAITVGELHIEEDALFGPGLIRAYLLESKAALYPRIIVDPHALQQFEIEPLLRSEHQPIDEQRDEVRELLKQDSDGVWFIDYLRFFVNEIREADVIAYLEKHKRVIQEELTDLKDRGLTPEATKYGWLTNYHNAFVRTSTEWLKEQGMAPKDLLVQPPRGTVLHPF